MLRQHLWALPDDDEDEVLADGQSIRVPLMAMDAIQRTVADNARTVFGDNLPDAADAIARSYEERDAWLSDAWRMPRVPATASPAPISSGDAVADARAQYIHRLENAWRSAK